MGRSIECRCEYNFTCRYCLREASFRDWSRYKPTDLSLSEAQKDTLCTHEHETKTAKATNVEKPK